jgi:membrane-bound lytic murein transglycosylase MltF
MRKLAHGCVLGSLVLVVGLGSDARAGGDRMGAPAVGHYDEIIQYVARSFSVEPALVKAVIAAESAFEPNAISRTGAQGLMQLMPETAAAMGVGNPFDPGENIEGGTRYLRVMLDRYGDMHQALAAYNAGPDAVDVHEGVPPYTETRRFVARVLRYYRDYLAQIEGGHASRPGTRAAARKRGSESGPYQPGTASIEMIRGTERSRGSRYQ